MKPEEFKDWRDRMGFTQQQAAEALGVDRRSITNYEGGFRKISETVQRLTECLEKDKDDG